MGYTHFWSRTKSLDRKLFKLAVIDSKKICDALPIPLGNWDGQGTPKFSPSEICFNGHVHSAEFAKEAGLVWPAAKAEAVANAGESVASGKWYAGSTVTARCVNANGDGSYETFKIRRLVKRDEFLDPEESKHFEFCKTNYRPYDLCVQCCLIVFNHFFSKQFLVRSDGKAEDWHEASNDCQAVLGYGLDFSLDRR